jgi:hypothetical protein
MDVESRATRRRVSGTSQSMLEHFFENIGINMLDWLQMGENAEVSNQHLFTLTF